MARISVTPVKGFALLHPDGVKLTERGVIEDRRFAIVDADGQASAQLERVLARSGPR